jgi:hypothetical protein
MELTWARISSHFQRIDAIRWTPYLDECLRMLAENREYPTDMLLAHFVRLQLIIERVTQAPWHDGPVDAAGSVRAPSVFYLKALQAQLEDFKRDVPPELQQNGRSIFLRGLPDDMLTLNEIGILLVHLYNTELSVHEITFSRAPVDSNSPDFQRLESLYACLQATRNWFDLFFTISLALYIGFSMSISHCIIALHRLSTINDPDWDRGLVRETSNLSLVLDPLVKKLAQVKVAARLDLLEILYIT